MNFKPYVWVLAAILGTAIAAGPVQAVPFSGMNGQEQHQDYSKNKRYKQGTRDGEYDRAHHKNHSKKRHYKKDEDQRAYEAGYRHAYGSGH
ncbi:MAG: hypothetical protein ACRD5K_18830 [Candidatus Acidiferrales bacterium]